MLYSSWSTHGKHNDPAATNLVISRRIVLLTLARAPLSACGLVEGRMLFGSGNDDPSSWYIGSRADQPFDIPLVDRTRMRPQFMPQTVAYSGSEAPGTLVVEVDQRFLFLVEEGGTARRYGIGVGRQGFSWKGTATVQRKAVWPDWSPTATMVSLNPDLPRRLKGGIDNPLGARALYLYQDGRDILFRIHGTNEPWSIGEQISSGCIRMLNEDVADLYERVPVGTTVIVRRGGRVANFGA